MNYLELNAVKTQQIKEKLLALTGVTEFVGHYPANQKVTGSIPGQGTCLSWGFRAHTRGNRLMFLSLLFSPPLSVNK